MLTDETIYALATVSGKSAIATFRISGKNTGKIIKLISLIKKIEIKKIKLTKIFTNKKKNEEADLATIIFYKSPKSYTGEDLAEITVHGGPAIIKEDGSTTVITPGWTGRADPAGNLRLTAVY